MSIDIGPERITVTHNGRSTSVRGRSVAFLCILIAEGDRFVSADEVYGLPGWGAMSRGSVGKQVARFIDSLRAAGHDIFDCRQKTNGWRLKPHVQAGIASLDVDRAKAILRELDWASWVRFRSVPTGEMSTWALQNVEALLAMTEGDAERGYAALKASYKAIGSDDLVAISDVLATRIGQRLSQPHLPLPARRSQNRSVFELAIEARRLSAYAIRSQSVAWPGYVTELEAMLPQVASRGDLTTQAILLNALALLHRRMGDFEKALTCIKEAVPLAVFSGDFVLIQNVMFNFGNVLSEQRRQDPTAHGTDGHIALLEMDLNIRRKFGIGKDSAQAELLLAYLALEEGDLQRSAAFLGQAEGVIAINNSLSDRALFHRVSGLLKITTSRLAGSSDAEGFAHLDRAILLFGEIGNEASAGYVTRERDELRSTAIL